MCVSRPIAAAYLGIWDASRGPQAGVSRRIGLALPPPKKNKKNKQPKMVRHSLPFVVIIVAIELIVRIIRIRVVVKVV